MSSEDGQWLLLLGVNICLRGFISFLNSIKMKRFVYLPEISIIIFYYIYTCHMHSFFDFVQMLLPQYKMIYYNMFIYKLPGFFLWWGWGGGLTLCYYSVVVSDRSFSPHLFLSLTGLNHKDNDNMDYYYQLEIWKGNINGVLRQAREREELSDWLVAMAPMGKSSSQCLV